jgi:hypothetical protein
MTATGENTEQAGPDEPVTLINVLEVAHSGAEEFVARWAPASYRARRPLPAATGGHLSHLGRRATWYSE